MGSDAKKSLNASRGDLLLFDPDQLTIVDDAAHPLYDGDRMAMPVDEGLVRSIMRRGVLQSIVVRRNGNHPDGRPLIEVVAGRRRVTHAREANRRLTEEGKEPVRVPACTRRGDDAEMFGIMIDENDRRKNDSPVVRARKVQRYLNMGRTIEDAAEQFAVTPATIKNLLTLLDCAAPVQRAIDEGRIPAATAKQFTGMSRGKQVEVLNQMIAAGTTKGAAADAAIRALKSGRKPVVKDLEAKKMRPRAVVLTLYNAAIAEGRTELACFLGYILGDKHALDKHDDAKEFVTRAVGD